MTISKRKLAILLLIMSISQGLSAQNLQPKQDRYRLIDLGTFRGPQSYVNIPPISYARALNNQGILVGYADTPIPDPFPDVCFDDDCFVAHAFMTRNGGKRDLGTLAEGVSSQPNWISANGLIAGVAQNGETDPLVPGFPELRAVLWKDGKIANLGTLEGGYESLSSSVNSRGQVVGFAVNTIPDPDSMVGLGFQTRAFLWQDGAMQDLGTLGTGTDAIALLINESGQIVGDSYVSSDPSEACGQAEIGTLATDAFLFDHGKMTDLGNFGGTCTFAFALNNRGQVVGGSGLPGDAVQHPFLWTEGKLTDLGTFGGDIGTALAINDAGDVVGWASYPGDEVLHAALWTHGRMLDLGALPDYPLSFAVDINERGQVLLMSASEDLTQFHPFLWQEGKPIVDLNDVALGSSLQLTIPGTINDRGDIDGVGVDANGNQHAFLLMACGQNCDEVTGNRNSPAAKLANIVPSQLPSGQRKSTFNPRNLVIGPYPQFARRYPTLHHSTKGN